MKARVLLFILLSLIPLGDTYAVYDDTVTVKCLDCHRNLPFDGKLSFNEGIYIICGKCHVNPSHSHPVQASPSMPIPLDMPLDEKGKLTCITCHGYHDGYDNTERGGGVLSEEAGGKDFLL